MQSLEEKRYNPCKILVGANYKRIDGMQFARELFIEQHLDAVD